MGRADICHPTLVVEGVQPLGEPRSIPPRTGLTGKSAEGFSLNRAGSPNKRDRSNFKFMLEIDGHNIEEDYQTYVRDIIVEESIDHSISKLTVRFHNRDLAFIDEELWKEHSILNLWIGYKYTGIQKRGNNWICMGAKKVYPVGESNAENAIVLTAYSQEFRLGRTQKRKVWTNVRDSEIAEQIAAIYGWGADVEQTDPVHQHVAQMQESDWKFLDRRARMYGYQLFVDDNDVLHFHPPRYIKSGIKLCYFRGDEGQLNGLTVWQETAQYGKEVFGSQVDPLSKELFNVSSQEMPDEVTTKTQNSAEYPVWGSQDISSMPDEEDDRSNPESEEQPRIFLYEEGHHQTRTELQREVEGFSQHTRWLIKAKGQVIGLEGLRVGEVIEILDIGRHSGEYYITSLESKIISGKFTSFFNCTRTWTGDVMGSMVRNSQVDLVEVPE